MTDGREDPSPAAPGGRFIDLTVQLPELRENPGRWARVLDKTSKASATKAADRIRDGVRVLGLRDTDALEVVVAGFRADAGTRYRYGVYVRSLPEDAAPLPVQPSPSKKVGYDCDLCAETFYTPGGLKHHVRRRHPNAA